MLGWVIHRKPSPPFAQKALGMLVQLFVDSTNQWTFVRNKTEKWWDILHDFPFLGNFVSITSLFFFEKHIYNFCIGLLCMTFVAQAYDYIYHDGFRSIRYYVMHTDLCIIRFVDKTIITYILACNVTSLNKFMHAIFVK